MTAILIIFSAALTAITAALIYLFKEVRRLPGSVNNSVNDAMQAATGAIGDINRNLGELKARGARLEDFGKAINEIGMLLRPPQTRGMTGEVLLEKVLSDMLPRGIYQMKYSFGSGEQVDAIVRFREYILPIDSKFPLESFKRMLDCEAEDDKRRCYREFIQAVKKEIDNISRKYILPGEKTLEFAFMYVPSESVYYEAVIRDKQFGEESGLLSYAVKNKVYIVSPATLYPYLSTIVYGLRAFKIEENAKQILDRIGALKKDFDDFRGVYEVIGSHINDAYKKYISEAARRIARVEADLSSLELRHKEESEFNVLIEDKDAFVG